MALLHFLEKIDLECATLPNEFIYQKALRMDGKGKKGLREELDIGNNCNCCDYLLPNKNKITFIEISDLIAQLHDIRQKHKAAPDNLKYLFKEPKQYISRELKLKIYGSLIILLKIPKKFKVKHEEIHQKDLEIIFVICSNKFDDVATVDYLTIDIRNTLRPLIKEVKLLNIPMLKDFLRRNYS